MLLPVFVLLLLTVVQAGIVARDQLLAVHATRVAGRAVIVEPSHSAATAALAQAGLDRVTVGLSGDLRVGGYVTVEVRLRPTRVALVGRLVGDMEVRERVTVLVER